MVVNPQFEISESQSSGSEIGGSEIGGGADLRAAVDVVGDRWVLLLVHALAGGPRRFGDLSRDLRGVAPNVLTDRLRRVERAGLVTGTPYQHRPRRLVYALTAAGEELAAILPALASCVGPARPAHRCRATTAAVARWSWRCGARSVRPKPRLMPSTSGCECWSCARCRLTSGG